MHLNFLIFLLSLQTYLQIYLYENSLLSESTKLVKEESHINSHNSSYKTSHLLWESNITLMYFRPLKSDLYIGTLQRLARY